VQFEKASRKFCDHSLTLQPGRQVALKQMSFVFIYFVVFFFLVFVVGPAGRIEDRPAFKRPDKKIRWLF
jgi:hypothetical protein